MFETRPRGALAALFLFLLTCSLATSSARADASSEQLNALVDEWYDNFLEMNPVMATFNGVHDYDDRLANSISPEFIEKLVASEHGYLERLEKINPEGLDTQDRLSWEIFRRDRMETIADAEFPGHLMPVNQMFSLPIFFVQMGSPGGLTPFNTAEDYDKFLSRIDDFVVWMDQAVTNMREGIERGVVLPQIIVEKTLPVLESQIAATPAESQFYSPIEAMPEEIQGDDRARLQLAYENAIAEKIVPAYRGLHAFMRDEYMPHARQTTALSALPDGEAWYRLAIAQNTSTNMTAEEIHELGKREVERIEGEMRKLAESVGFEGDIAQLREWVNSQEELKYSSEEDVLERYRGLRDRVQANIPKLFSLSPEADFEIRKVEGFRQATTPGAHYMPPSPDGSRLGIFYVNTGGWENRSHAMGEALYMHEAVPGHHFQIAIARELDELPRFRRYNGYTAYSEGWGLYAESLGEELGLYQDPFQKLGQLNSEIFRARRLVVDTGLHAMGWTREEALAYLPSEVEINRYIVMPGQALAYKVGELKIKDLRARAAARLGDRFDLREFHSQILKDGPLPLDVLEAKVDRWIESEATAGR
jgi:uncharacterized protein (DUF885 family)